MKVEIAWWFPVTALYTSVSLSTIISLTKRYSAERDSPHFRARRTTIFVPPPKKKVAVNSLTAYLFTIYTFTFSPHDVLRPNDARFSWFPHIPPISPKAYYVLGQRNQNCDIPHYLVYFNWYFNHKGSKISLSSFVHKHCNLWYLKIRRQISVQ
jgi:hypothetical protein